VSLDETKSTSRWSVPDLVAGLDRVEPLDPAGGRIALTNFTLIAAAYFSFVGWRIVQAVQSNSF
jgi:hypothetical protein